jgi:hypothetical protein
MVEETFTDAERQRLIGLVLAAMQQRDSVLLAILSKLTGTDTVIVAHRAYRSRYSQDTTDNAARTSSK